MPKPQDSDSNSLPTPSTGASRSAPANHRRRAPRRVFLGVAAFTAVCAYGTACGLLWMLFPRLAQVHILLADAFAAIILGACVLMFGSVAVVAASLRTRKAWRASEWVAARLSAAAPLVLVMARLLRVPEDEVRASLARVLSDLTRARLTASSCGRILCVTSRSLTDLQIKQISGLCAEWGTDFETTPPDTNALRDLVIRRRPSALVAVACPCLALSTTRELGYEVPLRVVRAHDLSEGYRLDLNEIRDVLIEVKNNFEVHPAPARELATLS